MIHVDRAALDRDGASAARLTRRDHEVGPQFVHQPPKRRLAPRVRHGQAALRDLRAADLVRQEENRLPGRVDPLSAEWLESGHEYAHFTAQSPWEGSSRPRESPASRRAPDPWAWP